MEAVHAVAQELETVLDVATETVEHLVEDYAGLVARIVAPRGLERLGMRSLKVDANMLIGHGAPSSHPSVTHDNDCCVTLFVTIVD